MDPRLALDSKQFHKKYAFFSQNINRCLAQIQNMLQGKYSSLELVDERIGKTLFHFNYYVYATRVGLSEQNVRCHKHQG